MNSAPLPVLAAFVIQSVLGAAVFLANPRRLSNQCFLLLSVAAAAWLSILYLTFTARDASVAAFYIRQDWATATMIVACLNFLRLSVTKRQSGWSGILRDSWAWLVLNAAVICFCQTKLFLIGARIPVASMGLTPVPVQIYGPGFLLFVVYGVGAIAVLIFNYVRDVRNSSGAEHAELAFISIGAISSLALSLLVAVIVPLFIPRSQIVWFAPFRVILFSLVIAYGIATRKIMEVGFFIRRAMSYFVLTAYLLALYGVTWWLVAVAFRPVLGSGSRPLAHVFAAIVVAFAMAPARGISQSLSDRLFVGTRRLDFRATMKKAADILKSVTTVHDLLERFALTTAEAMGTERVLIFMLDRNVYVQRYPESEAGGSAPQLEATDPVIQEIATHPEPLVLEELHRVRHTSAIQLVIDQMKELTAAAILGIFSREGLAGIMLLGARSSGRIYGSAEQSALQVLCGQLAVALENAQLFTEVQNAKIYNETLLHNLTTGVIAAGANEEITVFNDEAAQLTGVASGKVLERSINRLPAALCELLRETLRSGERIENRELTLFSDQGSVTVRASSSIFHSQEGERLGALMVLTDITALKKLELQIRRSDRLASLGTLSAGMAHEIKNPLVSIKTFAQLLPERYQDSDFRDTFSKLIGHEIDRIDSLVNQLLTFARPAKPHLKSVHVHEIIETSLQLLGHRLYQKDIKLVRSAEAKVDTIRADADQLEQVFLNFFLNAMDAMKRGGELSVSTEIRAGDQWLAPISQKNGEASEILCVTIRDNGEGIRSEDLVHVFDPFFTTKDYGTGLGLSVVHAIVQEHGGQIEVESELSKGTAFHILLPLVRLNGEEAAA
jgi:PAS domain S-box-containing protein